MFGPLLATLKTRTDPVLLDGLRTMEYHDCVTHLISSPLLAERAMESDRNLLFGVLALQAELIDSGQFIEACTAWAARKNKPLHELLLERGWIKPVDRDDVLRLMDRKLKKHGDDPTASIAAVADDEIRRVLAVLDDPELRETISCIVGHAGHVLISTLDHTPQTRERYSLTRLHAKGGIGQVWLARDADIGREVALKELRPERATEGSIWARFLEEARITGQLEHPGIVPVYELARREDDQPPFYTMRFVRGRTLTEAARAYHARRRESLTTPLDQIELLNAFLGVCNAVAYAHARGVIHRDLKGQNVVLGDFGEVIVLDWGLAKLVTAPPETHAAGPPIDLSQQPDRAETVAGQVLGTPAFMAPEQAEGRNDLVDQISDVYSLGAILYEILTGRPPFTGADTAEVLRKVIEGRPIRPRREIAEIPQAIEAVCMKALERDRAARYQSVADLAQDVRRFLADEPVSAYREPFTRRASRWAKKHRTLVASAAVLVLTALPLVSFAAIRINQERLRADRGFRQARQAVNEYFTQVSESTLLNKPGMQPLRKSLLNAAKNFYVNFATESQHDLSLRSEVARSLSRLAIINTVTSSHLEAADLQRRAVETWRALLNTPESDPSASLEFARGLNNLAEMERKLARLNQALQHGQEAAAVLEKLPPSREVMSEIVRNHALLGIVWQSLYRFDPAEAEYRAALALLDAHPDLSADPQVRLEEQFTIMGNLGSLLTQIGRVDEAEATVQKAVALAKAELQKRPDDLALQNLHSKSVLQLAGFYDQTNRPNETILQQLREAIAAQEQLVLRNPAAANFRETLGLAQARLGRMQLVMGRIGDADKSYEAADRCFEELARTYADEPDFLNQRATVLMARADWFASAGRDARALPLYRQVLPLREQLAGQYPDTTLYRTNLAQVHRALAQALQRQFQFGEAETHLHTAISLYTELVQSYPQDRQLQADLSQALLYRAINAHTQDQTKEAEEQYRQLIAFMDERKAAHAGNPEFNAVLARAWANLGTLLHASGRADEALPCLAQTFSIAAPHNPRTPWEHELRNAQRDAQATRARILDEQGRKDEAIEAWDQAIDFARGTPYFGNFQLTRIGTLARHGDYLAAQAALGDLLGNKPPPPALFYDVACIHALCARAALVDATMPTEEREARANEFAQQAVELLRKAREAGFFLDPNQRTNFARDPDLDPLRDRPDFQDLARRINPPTKP